MKATLSNYNQSPRKVRLLADLVRGKSVAQALKELDFVAKRAALPIKQLIESAVANANNNFNIKADNLLVKEIRVDKGVVMKRFQARARGRAFPIRHRTSHVKVELSATEVEVNNKKVTKAKAVVASQ
ncbi:MAG: 50S ribosomal protein L22 [Candidatus Vogelbacteria bacterium RIFOXYD1_FULL_46_19]|uniref:Large ribosomal subunit protein uL22 n=1 Tax=Candidatus Vogelbacteria bacterium RIFOXYD1_FULL_46_19 TaxID=1802439 RepID=A0A1G2QI47_9BACT|nr:MAG: 50S ribosomal protein L22 [Candidatus Vogelbacteria bacterium RIFOXYD1_FULL_46_19]